MATTTIGVGNDLPLWLFRQLLHLPLNTTGGLGKHAASRSIISSVVMAADRLVAEAEHLAIRQTSPGARANSVSTQSEHLGITSVHPRLTEAQFTASSNKAARRFCLRAAFIICFLCLTIVLANRHVWAQPSADKNQQGAYERKLASFTANLPTTEMQPIVLGWRVRRIDLVHHLHRVKALARVYLDLNPLFRHECILDCSRCKAAHPATHPDGSSLSLEGLYKTTPSTFASPDHRLSKDWQPLFARRRPETLVEYRSGPRHLPPFQVLSDMRKEQPVQPYPRVEKRSPVRF